MPSAYLHMLDDLLAEGTAALSEAFRQAQVKFVMSFQQPDGGFAGRRGGTDLYYTDFGVRCLAALGGRAQGTVLARGGQWCAEARPANPIDCFNLLNIQRLGGGELSAEAVVACLGRPRRPSAYQMFLACLCYEMLDRPMPNGNAVVEAMMSLRRDEGGWCESPDSTMPQTNSTAATVATLTILSAVEKEMSQKAAEFLSRQQSDNGGFLAHRDAPSADLLSTFTAMLALAGLDRLDLIDLAAAGRFVRAMALPAGGFRGAAGDDAGDVEYTWYGLGCLAILRRAASG